MDEQLFWFENLALHNEGELKLIIIGTYWSIDDHLTWDDLKKATGLSSTMLYKAYQTLSWTRYEMPEFLEKIFLDNPASTNKDFQS